MQQFKVHLFEEVRRTFLVEAEDMAAVEAMVKDYSIYDLHGHIESEATGKFTDDVLVDPLLEDGSVDCDNSKWMGGEE